MSKKSRTAFKSSSPFASSTGFGQKFRHDPSHRRHKYTSPSNHSKYSNEQIIGVEFVCVVGNGPSDSESLERRTRTTTLTPENLIAESKSGDTLNNETTQSTTETNLNSIYIDPNAPARKSVFFSRFTRFNLHCLLDLIEEKDLNEFKSIIKRMEISQQDSELPIEGGKTLKLNDFKIYLRFSWYSYNELNNYSTLNLPNSSSASKIITPNTAFSYKVNFSSFFFPSSFVKVFLNEIEILFLKDQTRAANVSRNGKPLFGGSKHFAQSANAKEWNFKPFVDIDRLQPGESIRQKRQVSSIRV